MISLLAEPDDPSDGCNSEWQLKHHMLKSWRRKHKWCFDSWKKNKEIIVMTKWNLVWPCISSIVCLSTPQGNQCEISHFQASVGACNLILHIHVVVKWQLSSRVSPDGNTQLFHGLRCLPREVMCFFEVTCTCWQVTSFSTDGRLNSKCISVNGYKFIVWSKL